MWFVVAILSSFVFGWSTLLFKLNQVQKGSYNHFLLGLYLTGAMGFLVNSIAVGPLALGDWRLWAAGVVVGAGSTWGNIVCMKVLENGPASISVPLMNMYVVIIVVFSTYFYHEPLGLSELTGITLLFAAVVLISLHREPLTIRERKWYLLMLVVIIMFTFRNGGLKVTGELGLDNTQVLFLAYIMSFLWFGAASVTAYRKNGLKEPLPELVRTGLKWGSICGVFSYGGLQLFAMSLEMGKANVAVPIFATNSLVVVIGSLMLFGEKLTRLQAMALVFLFSGLILVRL